MKNKQIIGIVVAALVLVFIGASNVLVNNMSISQTPSVSSLTKGIDTSALELPSQDYIGVVEVVGTIMDVDSQEIFSQPSYNHKETLQYIDNMMKSDSNKGILLYVNSPGGTVSDSDELYLKLMEYKKETKRPIYTYMDDMACSGGYYIAMASDYVMGNRNGWTGSVGVILQLTNLKGLYEKIGVEQTNITSGANKSMGSPGEVLTDEQTDILQGMVDESYEQFVDIVATGRKMSKDQVKVLADGRIYTMKQAKENQLIDEVVNTYDDCLSVIRKKMDGAVTFYTPEQEINPLKQLLGFATELKKGSMSDAELLKNYLEQKGNGVPMYYAKPE